MPCSVIRAVHHGSAWQKGDTRLVGKVCELCRVRKLINQPCSRLRAAWTCSRLVGNGRVEAFLFSWFWELVWQPGSDDTLLQEQL